MAPSSSYGNLPVLGRYGAVNTELVSAAVTAAGQTGAGAGGKVGKSVASAASVGGTAVTLLTAAAGSATVPVAGWIAAAGLTIAAGIITFIGLARKGKLTRKQAVAKARQMGIKEAGEVPGWTAKVLNASHSKRVKLGRRIERHLKKKKGGLWGHLLSIGRSEKRERWKLAIVGAVIKLDDEARAGREPPPAPRATIDAALGGPSTGTLALLGVLGAALFFVVMSSGGRSSSSSKTRENPRGLETTGSLIRRRRRRRGGRSR